MNYKSTSIELAENGIVYCRAFANDSYNEEDLNALVDRIEQLTGGEPYLLMMEMKNHEILLSREARNYLSSDERTIRLTKAEAVVINSTIGKTIFNLIMRLDRPKFPFQAFTNEEDAAAWLLTHR